MTEIYAVFLTNVDDNDFLMQCFFNRDAAEDFILKYPETLEEGEYIDSEELYIIETEIQ